MTRWRKRAGNAVVKLDVDRVDAVLAAGAERGEAVALVDSRLRCPEACYALAALALRGKCLRHDLAQKSATAVLGTRADGGHAVQRDD